MIIDTQLQFSDAQALSGATSTNSTNVIDFGTNARQIGSGEPMVVAITVDVAAGGTTPTLAVALKMDNNSTPSTTVLTTQTYAAAALGAGAKIFVPVPQGIAGRYMMLTYTQTGTTPTITLTAQLMAAEQGLQNEAIYPANYTVA